MLRVISGSAKKRRLKSPRGMAVRPTSDRVKEALFNITGSRIPGCFFLDLFAGTGSIGIEALSRGASSVVFIENNSRNIQVIRENLKSTGFTEKARLICQALPPALNALGREGLKFDLIFLDPPYLKDFETSTLAAVAANSLLKTEGRVIVESSKKCVLPGRVANLEMSRQEKYGDTLLSFYQINGSTGVKN
ncbi:16S rRNA (guanine(966)-N(2))-methyltransferase RsmD [Pelotomaculum propionicicum]|nr:16S rRNA (guanine(966)-N(2))-methyltransferase RsmD [Pelotomaculum propionicicum]